MAPLAAVLCMLAVAGPAQARRAFTFKPRSPLVGQRVTFITRRCHSGPCRYQWADRPPHSRRTWPLGRRHPRWHKSRRLVVRFSQPGVKYVAVRARDRHHRVHRWRYLNGVTRRSRARGIRIRTRPAAGTPPSRPPVTATPPPGVLPAPVAPCDAIVSSTAAAATALASAPAGSTVCLADGGYGTLSASAHRGSAAILRAQNAGGAHVTDVRLSGSNYVIEGFDVKGTVELAAGTHAVRVSHNDIHEGDDGVSFVSTDCTVPNAPKWSGCAPQPPISDVIVDGNRIHDVSTDALFINNWRNVRISGNEISGVIENGAHNDCLQSVFGGSGMVFDHNYEHDNNCQGFFIKDGDASNVLLTENLFVRNRAINASESTVQVYNTVGFVFEHNTDWSGNGWVVRSDHPADTPTATVAHNYIYAPARITDSGTPYTLVEDDDTFHDPPAGFRAGPHSNVSSSPAWVAAGSDDYRVAGSDRGIDWRPADLHFGP